MYLKRPKVTVFLLLVQLGHTKDCSMYKYSYFGVSLLIKMSGAVNPNTPHSLLVCSMLNEIAKYLKLFMSLPSVTIMTSAS